MKLELLFIPEHVKHGFEMCNVDLDTLIFARDRGNVEIVNACLGKLSKHDIRDAISVTDYMHKKLMRDDDAVSEICVSLSNEYENSDKKCISPEELMNLFDGPKTIDSKSLLKNHNIMSRDINLLPMDKISMWLNFKRINDTYVIFVKDDFLRLLASNDIVGLLLFYKTFMNILYRRHGDDIYNFTYFKNFLNLIKNTQGTNNG